jgi:perosamine synthetase
LSIDEEIGAAAPSIPVFDLRMEQEDLDAVEATLRSGWWTQGPRVEEFERVFAEHLGVRHVVATSSCTTALHLALLAAGVGPGDEVIVPSFTFVATVATVMQTGATPIFGDIAGQHDLCMDPEQVAGLIGPRTKAVMPVHYGGYAASPGRTLPSAATAAARSAPSASPAASASSPTRCSGSARAAASAPTATRPRRGSGCCARRR